MELWSRRTGRQARRSAGGSYLFWVAAWLLTSGLVLPLPLAAADPAPAFSFGTLRERARSLAAQDFKA